MKKIILILLLIFTSCSNKEVIEQPKTILEKAFEISQVWQNDNNSNVKLVIDNINVINPFDMIFQSTSGCYIRAKFISENYNAEIIQNSSDTLELKYSDTTLKFYQETSKMVLDVKSNTLNTKIYHTPIFNFDINNLNYCN